jgi:hypothetical protein
MLLSIQCCEVSRFFKSGECKFVVYGGSQRCMQAGLVSAEISSWASL